MRSDAVVLVTVEWRMAVAGDGGAFESLALPPCAEDSKPLALVRDRQLLVCARDGLAPISLDNRNTWMVDPSRGRRHSEQGTCSCYQDTAAEILQQESEYCRLSVFASA